MLRSCIIRRSYCNKIPIYETIEDFVSAQRTKEANVVEIGKRDLLHHPRLERSLAYFRHNEDRYPYVVIPPPDKNILGLLRKPEGALDFALRNAESASQCVKTLEILATFSDSLKCDENQRLETSLSLLLSHEYSLDQILEAVANLSKANVTRLRKHTLFLEVVKKLSNSSLAYLREERDFTLAHDLRLRMTLLKLSYLWLRYRYSFDERRTVNCPFTLALINRLLSYRKVVESLTKEEIVFISFLIGNTRIPTPYVKELLEKLALTTPEMDVDEVSIICGSWYVARMEMRRHDPLVASLIDKILSLPPNDVNSLERVLSPVCKILKKATRRHVHKKRELVFKFYPVFQHLSFNTRVYFLKFISVNGCMNIQKPLNFMAESFEKDFHLENARIKDWESIVQSLVLLNYENDNFYCDIARRAIDSCGRQNHRKNFISLVNLVLYLTYNNIFKTSSITRIFQVMNSVDLTGSVMSNVVTTVNAIASDDFSDIHDKTGLVRDKYTYYSLIRNVIQIDDVVSTFVDKKKCYPRLNTKSKTNFSAICEEFDDLTEGTIVSSKRQLLMKDLNLSSKRKNYSSVKIFPHFRTEDIIIRFNDASDSIEEIPNNYKRPSNDFASSGRNVVLLVPKNISFLHKYLPNGNLNFQKRLLERAGYDVVIVNNYASDSFLRKEILLRLIRSSRTQKSFIKPILFV